MQRSDRYVDERSRPVRAQPDVLWRVIEGIGGDRGWYSSPLAWRIRGAVDRLVGGIGLRRGRRDPDQLRPGDALDFWRVEEVRRGELLRLRAEMRLPGVARLELRAATGDGGRTELHQRTTFVPHGAAGHCYWWANLPLHKVVFARMASTLAAVAAVAGETAGRPAEGTSDGPRSPT